MAMEVLAGHRAFAGRERPLAGPAVALGNFDGVHLGHRALLDRACWAARASGGAAMAFTFDPHPTALLAPHLAPPLITTTARKLDLIAATGIDACVVEPFTAELAAMSAVEFVDQVLVGAMNVRHVAVGWDFTYGKGRTGTTSTLEQHGLRAGFTVEVLDKVLVDHEVASSTRIRGYLRGGDLARAARLLGRPYDIEGVVVHGAKRGRELGIPTANVRTEGDLLVGTGVYAVRLAALGGDGAPTFLDGVASVGTNPTFGDGNAMTFEVHVLDWSGDLYGQRVRVQLIARLREERKYPSADAMMEQIRDDIRQGRELLAAKP
jgi:riboflavin kinase/FMN adenylyltransferase